MPFPDAPRVIFQKNPLELVVCQLRFPPILKIDAELPAAFQEEIRDQFPMLAETTGWQLEVPPPLRGAIPPEAIAQIMQASTNKNYEFSSQDGHWKVNLTRTFMALSTTSYRRWEQFKAKLQGPLRALTTIYRPTAYTRVGLRYVDVIKRSSLGLANAPWPELLSPHVLGVLAAPELGQQVAHLESRSDIRLADGRSTVRLVTALRDDDGEACFVLDSDFFRATDTSPADAEHTLDFFSTRSSRLIQWAVTKRLRDAMGADAA